MLCARWAQIVALETAARANKRSSMGTDAVDRSQLWVRGTKDELWANWAAFLTLVSVVLSLSISAKYWAPSDLKLFKPTLKTMGNFGVRGC